MYASFAAKMFRMPLNALILSALTTGAAFAAVVPDESETSSLEASVSEQATLTVPAIVEFQVTDVTAGATSAAQDVSATNVVLNDGNSLKISVKANTAEFTKPTNALASYVAGDVSWNQANWSNGTGASGTLAIGYTVLDTSIANPGSSETSNLVFTLAGRSPAEINRAGIYTMVVTYKLESISP